MHSLRTAFAAKIADEVEVTVVVATAVAVEELGSAGKFNTFTLLGAVNAGGTVMLVAAEIVRTPEVTTMPARARPLSVPPPNVMLVFARTVPTIVLVATDVKDVPTTQTTLFACAPLTSRTDAPLARLIVDPALKTKIAFGLPCASSVMLVGILMLVPAL